MTLGTVWVVVHHGYQGATIKGVYATPVSAEAGKRGIPCADSEWLTVEPWRVRA